MASSSGSEAPDRDPHSSFKLAITLEIGYERKRSLAAGRLEANLTSVTLLVGGVIISVLVILGLLRIFQALPF